MANNDRFVTAVFKLTADIGKNADEFGEALVDALRELPSDCAEIWTEKDSTMLGESMVDKFGDCEIRLEGVMVTGGPSTIVALPRPEPQHNDVMGTTCEWGDNGECCWRDHARATPPWTCPCDCHSRGSVVNRCTERASVMVNGKSYCIPHAKAVNLQADKE